MENTRTKPNWLELPRDVTLNILQRLRTVEIITSACLVCPLWWNFCKEPCIWRTIRMHMSLYSHYDNEDLVKMCRYAVLKSCGQLEEIYISSFGNDELLEYITNSATQLRRVGLVQFDYLSEEAFIEAVKKLPLIEELDVSNNIYLSKVSFEVVGSYCPLLKSLKYGRDVLSENAEAFVIAKTMPGLRSLTVSGIVLSSDGIVAILNGCPLLESLDLRYCSSMYPTESLRKRCCEQIKIFMPPMLEDCDFYCCADNWDSASWYSD
ncbi:hypothetical protein RYX36_017848 [Vicia faba]